MSEKTFLQLSFFLLSVRTCYLAHQSCRRATKNCNSFTYIVCTYYFDMYQCVPFIDPNKTETRLCVFNWPSGGGGSKTLSFPFLFIRTKCSSLGGVGKGQHPRDEILGAEMKGRDISCSINSGNTKPRRREENLSGAMEVENWIVYHVGEHN